MGFTAENYKDVDARVRAACERAGRDRSEVTLIAVSKTKPLEQVCDLIEAGVRDFGENKVQELTGKQDVLAGRKKVSEDAHVPAGERDTFDVPSETAAEVRWHLIGHLQRNKVKYIVGRAALIHSVDSLRLAEEIEKEAVKLSAAGEVRRDAETRTDQEGLRIPVLIEVNIGNEESKSGVAFGEAKELVRQVAALPHVRIRGLMCIAPYVDDPEENRGHFARMRALRDEIAAEQIPGVEMTELSMGMTGDFEVAVEEGATLVRVGTAIFGARDYANI